MKRQIRRLIATASDDEALHAEIVTIDGEQRFLVLKKELDHTELLVALQTAVDAELLKSKWLDWTAPAHVAIAVPLEDDIEDCRIYTYLPMDKEAASPFHGHLHAPFYTDYARRTLVWDHPFNSMLLDAVAMLAVEANKLLLTGSLSTQDTCHPGAPGAAAAAVDVVSWSKSRVGHLVGALGQRPPPEMSARPHYLTSGSGRRTTGRSLPSIWPTAPPG